MGEAIAVMVSARTRTASVRLHVVEVARELAGQAFAIVTKIVNCDEWFLRDQLEHKASTLPVLARQAVETDSMIERRALYVRARRLVLDCVAILDGLGKHRAIEAEPLNGCRTTAGKLAALLLPLTIPPLR